jgi:hypothetical protein
MTRPVRIPSDINRPDRVVGPFTARQAAILTGTGAALYLTWTVLRPLLAAPLFLAGAAPIAVAAVVIALGHRDQSCPPVRSWPSPAAGVRAGSGWWISARTGWS